MKTKKCKGTMKKYLEDEFFKVIKYPNHPKAKLGCRFVYLFRNPLTELCKVGVTDNPLRRLGQISTTSGMEVQNLITLECEVDYDEDPKFIEQFIHKHYKKKRKIGEWFNFSIKDIIEIRNLFYSIYGEDIQDSVKEHLLKND